MMKHRSFFYMTTNSLLDPYFDEMGGELALAQIRDPVLTLGEMWNPVHPTGGDPVGFIARQRDRKLAKIHRQQRQLHDLGMRLRKTQNLRLRKQGERLHQLIDWQMRRRGPQWNWLPKIGGWLQRRQCQLLEGHKNQLARLAKRFLAAQLKTYPKFNFGKWWIYKCEKCVPYNGHHTINYWATGQKDCW